ncbi:hypothetical protein [uncultured Clostridium sp.]|uniref:hypothetical protein n=1 Tax=uncultured Clostridium sp. TaxID=59620 RepID=UPI002605B535|nr:hypothetical protein [uncultured Clostridium sp.]
MGKIGAKWIAPIILAVIVSYILIIGGIQVCNNSYTMNHRGIFTDEFAHGNFHKIK